MTSNADKPVDGRKIALAVYLSPPLRHALVAVALGADKTPSEVLESIFDAWLTTPEFADASLRRDVDHAREVRSRIRADTTIRDPSWVKSIVTFANSYQELLKDVEEMKAILFDEIG